MPRPRLIRRSLRDALESRLGATPVGIDDLVGALSAEFPNVTKGDVDRELLELPAALVTESGWVDVFALADGVVLTHVLREEEITSGSVEAEPDFTLWTLVADEGVPLAGGGEVSLVFAEGGLLLRGPTGWLSDFQPDDIIALRLRDGELHMSGVRDEDLSFEDPVTQDIAEALTLAAESALGAFLTIREKAPSLALATRPLANTVADALAGERDLLRQPTVPLLTILAMSGLEFDDGDIALPGASVNSDDHVFTDDDIRARVRAATFLHYARLSSDFVESGAAEFLDDMTSDVVALFIADQVEAAPLSPDTLAAIERCANGRRQQAMVALLRARALEGRYDSAGAEELVREALRLDPLLVPALLDAGEYAAERGVASTADGYLKRAGFPSWDPLRSTLSPLSRPPASSTGRNKPCPCGSGRKHKVCCLRDEIHPLSVRAPLAHARLCHWAMRAPRRHIYEHLLSHIDPELADGELIAIDLAMFEPDVLSSYLMARGQFLHEDERVVVEQWRASRLAPYEVTATAPGTSVTLRPLLGGDPVTVLDRAMSTSVRRLDMVICRILTDGERPKIMMPPLAISRMRRQEVLEAFAADDPHAVVEFFGPKPPPTLENSEGHALVFSTRQYRVPKSDAAEGWRRLTDRLSSAGRDSLEWLSQESRVRGTVRRRGLQWTLEANSVERMEELAALVRESAPRAELVSSSAEPAADKLASTPPPRHLQAVPDLEVQEVLRAHILEYERKWVDDAIPALGGRTPRECVAAGGTALTELRALLDDFESMGDEGMSAHRLRAKLGIPQQ